MLTGKAAHQPRFTLILRKRSSKMKKSPEKRMRRKSMMWLRMKRWKKNSKKMRMTMRISNSRKKR